MTIFLLIFRCYLYLQALAENQRMELRESFENVKYFCATSDMWTRSNMSFIAVSVHYYEPNTLKLQIKFIACEHFPGRHTNDSESESEFRI